MVHANTVRQLLRKTQLHFSWAIASICHSWTQLITRFWESVAAWIWVASQQNWRHQAVTGLNSGTAVNHHLRDMMRFSCFCVLPGSAEALLRLSGKITYNLTACFLSNNPAKNCQNWLTCVKVIASQSSVVGHVVDDLVSSFVGSVGASVILRLRRCFGQTLHGSNSMFVVNIMCYFY